MSIRRIIQTLLFSLCLWQAVLPAQAQTTAVNRVLILYDAPQSSKFGFAGAILLRNLLGHFNASVQIANVAGYSPGAINNYDTVFYMGASYDNPIPAAFLQDVDANLASAAPKTVVWFKYNIWQLAWNTSYNFTGRTGITFSGLQGFNSPPSSTNTDPGFYSVVNYKGKAMPKYYAFNAQTGIAAADPDVGATSIMTPAQTLATVSNPKLGSSLPYVVKSNKFWYFADLPVSYIGPRDRYLALADLLHDILGQNHPEQHRALVRLEDVGADVNTASMKYLTDYMFARNMPFAIATIARYVDQFGVYNNGVREDIPLTQATNLKNALNYTLTRGGQIVQHGYTHQSDTIKNTISGVSGDDYEFWDMNRNAPMAMEGTSTKWALARMEKGFNDLVAGGYTPFAWEAPHYQSSPWSIKANVSKYQKVYGRVVYYTSDMPNLTGGDYAVGQFYPYIIYNDFYGQKVIPENLGNIEFASLCSYCFDYTYQDITKNADYALVVRDGFASFFFHPFLLDPNANVPGKEAFIGTINGINSFGKYVWSSPKDVQ